MSASCAFYVLSAKATYCSPLPSRVITSFIGTMGESDSSVVFVRTHHCIGRYSLLAHVQNHPGLPGTLDITISGMPCSRTDRKSTRLNSSHVSISYAVFCLKKKTET